MARVDRRRKTRRLMNGVWFGWRKRRTGRKGRLGRRRKRKRVVWIWVRSRTSRGDLFFFLLVRRFFKAHFSSKALLNFLFGLRFGGGFRGLFIKIKDSFWLKRWCWRRLWKRCKIFHEKIFLLCCERKGWGKQEKRIKQQQKLKYPRTWRLAKRRTFILSFGGRSVTTKKIRTEAGMESRFSIQLVHCFKQTKEKNRITRQVSGARITNCFKTITTRSIKPSPSVSVCTVLRSFRSQKKQQNKTNKQTKEKNRKNRQPTQKSKALSQYLRLHCSAVVPVPKKQQNKTTNKTPKQEKSALGPKNKKGKQNVPSQKTKTLITKRRSVELGEKYFGNEAFLFLPNRK